MIALLGLLEEHGDAVEYDLIGLGLRLRDFPSAALSWRDLLVIVRHAPATSAIVRALDPNWQRTPEVDLLREVEHGVRVLAWQQTRDGSKGRNAPERLRLPWDAVETDRPDSYEWDDLAAALGGDSRLAEFMARF